MENRSPSLREKVKQLRRTFVDKLPGTLAEARRLCDLLVRVPSDDSTLDDLYRTFHSIKGTAASFGLLEISAEGAGGEQLVLQLQGLEGGSRGQQLSALLPGFQQRLERLEELWKLARQADESNSSPESPSFDLGKEGAKAASKKLFICDDDEAQAEILAAQLSCFGYGVTIFTSPDSMRAALLVAPPDAVIMDIVFPGGVNGTDVVANLHREMRAPPPVVFVSSRRDFEPRLRAVQAGGEAYFPKPVKAIELVEILDSLTLGQEPEPFRVLVVDDEPEVAAYHSFILEQVGMTTRLLHEPATILDVLAEFKPDLVLMDMYMPTCTGRDLSRLIRQVPEFISLPIVFLSSETNKVKQVSALRVGAEGFLTKPIQPEDLISAVAIRAERMRTLRSLMVRDSLTGLFNHTFMSQFLETSLASARRDDGMLCFVMIDVDHFKQVNDTYGHPAGDQVLVALARLLQQRLRNSDMVGRYGGEEFAVILQDIGTDEASRIVDDLRADFAKVRFTAGDGDFSCTFSAGIAGYPGKAQADLLLESADQALYVAKKSGRNQVQVAP
ncbi:GGDEF domain-containing response regulator [Magnetospirillum gryphiswaldense]|uniref:diguanylate cyclase n=1 Tax=Magnetospirillum gryphiswaldense TaxID=55518 RepID=A4TVP8_9PROT|nr:diguanylate cyclase [Magnetospirillum gryphiswaldense]AVM75153.1 signal transduction protein containing GGDEF domain [Magnetospirillum gryphiswaldense MSR-1]AVM79056.1 signal transduction protein containing GGDEF domain [Magnetospirillum gryphiswaldense]CAM74705.1 Response regulator containing a CheY-like receiver domain and a GGDEF domain [Magnetospirillum gryphiswaldense MSR-1]